jgi:1,4-dihydroxy-6-naphthoate synthase
MDGMEKTVGKQLTLGHSPDPDDAFMFYGLAKGLVPSHWFEFELE